MSDYNYNDKMEKTVKLMRITGHPLNTFDRENKALTEKIEEEKLLLEKKDIDKISSKLEEIRQIAIHYDKKGDLLYPHLKVKYGVEGPSDMMWTKDDEIRDEIAYLTSTKGRNDEWLDRVTEVLDDLTNMIFQEERVLFPNCANYFSQEEWIGIYKDAKDYPMCLNIDSYIWESGEVKNEVVSSLKDGEIVMQGGHMTVDQLTALLNVIPMEITFIDENNINRYFNEGSKVFKRPGMAIDREVFSCHPPKVEEQVRKILDEFKKGTLDTVPMWSVKNGKVYTVTYMAVRDKDGKYLGTVELVQNMEHAREYFQKRKVDILEEF